MTASSDASEAPAAPGGLDDGVDRVLRHLTQCFPEMVAQALVPEAHSIGAVRWMETQVSARQRRLDRSVWVEVDGSPRIEHVAWQLRGSQEQPFRVYEYRTLLALSLREGKVGEASGKRWVRQFRRDGDLRPKKKGPPHRPAAVLARLDPSEAARPQARTQDPRCPPARRSARTLSHHPKTLSPRVRARGLPGSTRVITGFKCKHLLGAAGGLWGLDFVARLPEWVHVVLAGTHRNLVSV